MNYNFIRQEIGDVVRLRLDVEAGMEVDEFALHMMNRNDPSHLIPVQMVQRDSAFYLQYDVNDMRTLQNRLSKRLEKKEAIHILNSVIEAFEEVEDYMLTEDVLEMDMNYVYIDPAGQCRFLCVPCKQKGSDEQILFLRRVVEHMLMCYADTDTLLYDLLNAYNRDGIRKLSDMKDILRKLGDPEPMMEEAAAVKREFAPSENASQVNLLQKNIPQEKPAEENQAEERKRPNVGFEIPGQKKSVSSVGFEIPGQGDAVFPILEKGENKKGKNQKEGKMEAVKKTGDKEGKTKNSIIGKVFKKNGAGEKETLREQVTVPGNDGVKATSDMYESYEATVMVADMEIPGTEFAHEGTQMLGSPCLTGVLIRRKTQEQFLLSEGESVIGSGSAATCVISGNKAISRLHVIVKIEKDRVSVRDNHSSNGTWVDGRKLIDGNTVFVGNHAVIKLADEEFVFTLKRQ